MLRDKVGFVLLAACLSASSPCLAGWVFSSEGDTAESNSISGCEEFDIEYTKYETIIKFDDAMHLTCRDGQSKNAKIIACYNTDGKWRRFRWFEDKDACINDRSDHLKDSATILCDPKYEAAYKNCETSFKVALAECSVKNEDIERQINISDHTACKGMAYRDQVKCRSAKATQKDRLTNDYRKCPKQRNLEKVTCLEHSFLEHCVVNING